MSLTEHQYRGITIRHDSDPHDKGRAWSFPKGWHRIYSATKKGIEKEVDKYLHEEEVGHTPVLRGAIYCSPRCGYKCTKAAHDRAVRLGAALAKRMGEGWSPSVWENAGWHYCVGLDVADGSVTIHNGKHGPAEHAEGESEYTCYLNVSPQFIARHTDPVEAFRAARQELKNHVDRLAGMADFLGA